MPVHQPIINGDIREEGYASWLAYACLPADVLDVLFQKYGNSEEIYHAFINGELAASDLQISASAYKKLEIGNSPDALDNYQRTAEKIGMRVITSVCPEYPQILRGMPQAPSLLFYLGDPHCLNQKMISVIGSRMPSVKGREATLKIASDLSRNGVVIVSGLAYGIDTAAHIGCLEGGSPTIAVFGCGVDRVYPIENEALKNRILDNGGLLLSEYAIGDKPYGWHFPYRNRIISGLGKILVMMEARLRSGSMTTVRHALDQGKDVYVYPGDPGSVYAEGAHALLREGAVYFTGADDILEDLGWVDKESNVSQNVEARFSADKLPPAQRKIYECLSEGEIGFDRLSVMTMLPPGELSAALTMLQINGIIKALPGKSYVRAI